MAIDFSQVKSITIPEGNVKSITVGGVVIWQEQSAKVLTSITLSGQTTSLARDSAFSFGGTVTAHYDDSSTADVTADTTFSGYNMSTKGTYTVTASYTENGVTKTATYSLTVTAKWVTLWSGTKTITWSNGSGQPSDQSNFAQSATGQGTTPQIRVTFSISTSSIPTNYSAYYYKNSTSQTSSKPGSPQSFTIGAENLIGVGIKYSMYKEVKLTRTVDSTNNRVKFNLKSAYGGGGYPGGTLTLKITKIEQYY